MNGQLIKWTSIIYLLDQKYPTSKKKKKRKKKIATQNIKQVLQQLSEEHNKTANGSDNSNNIDNNNISSMNESFTFRNTCYLLYPIKVKSKTII